jgi:hypothetical protein
MATMRDKQNALASQRQAADEAAINMNLRMRQMLLGSSPRENVNLNTYNTGLGGTIRIKANNVGVGTKFLLYVTAAVTIGTATAVPSAKAPYNLISRIRFTDYDGTDRFNISGFQLFVLNCVRRRSFYGYNNEAATAVLANPVVPTAVGAGVVSFFIEVPLAFDVDNPVVMAQDLRGAMMMQTAVGEAYLNIDFTNSLYTNVDVDSLYAGAGTTTVALTTALGIGVTCWQEFIMPQAIGPNGEIPIPMIDINTVYEFVGNIRSSDNLAANAQRLFPYPNLRSVIGSYFNFVSGAVLANTVTGLKLIVNANNIIMDDSRDSRWFKQRLFLNGTDIAPGVFFYPHRDRPVETWLFGNYQMGFTPSAVGTNPYVESGFESFYTKGAALPGVPQAS